MYNTYLARNASCELTKVSEFTRVAVHSAICSFTDRTPAHVYRTLFDTAQSEVFALLTAWFPHFQASAQYRSCETQILEQQERLQVLLSSNMIGDGDAYDID